MREELIFKYSGIAGTLNIPRGHVGMDEKAAAGK